MDDPREMEFATRYIARKARRLVGVAGITHDDLPDIKQDLWLDLLEHLPDFRADLGDLRPFIRRVVNNAIATILAARKTAKRGGGLMAASLNEEFEDEDGEMSELHESISQDDFLRRTRGTIRSEEERRDLALDVVKLIGRLAHHECAICRLLGDLKVSTLAGVMGLPRSTLRDLIKRLRRMAEELGLRIYFE